MTQDVTQAAEQLEQPRRWYFTFGYGQRLIAATAAGSIPDAENVAGIPLDNCYVAIDGDFAAARAEMIRIFGRVWCDQYDVLPGGPGWPPMRDLTALVHHDQ